MTCKPQGLAVTLAFGGFCSECNHGQERGDQYCKNGAWVAKIPKYHTCSSIYDSFECKTAHCGRGQRGVTKRRVCCDTVGRANGALMEFCQGLAGGVDCSWDFQCDSGVCNDNNRCAHSPGNNGDSCYAATANACRSGLYCNPDEGRCRPPPSDTSTYDPCQGRCHDATQFCAFPTLLSSFMGNNLFSRFSCRPKLPPGSKCTANNQCFSGNCRSSDVTNPHLGTEKYCGCDADSTDPKLGCKEGERCVKLTQTCLPTGLALGDACLDHQQCATGGGCPRPCFDNACYGQCVRRGDINATCTDDPTVCLPGLACVNGLGRRCAMLTNVTTGKACTYNENCQAYTGQVDANGVAVGERCITNGPDADATCTAPRAAGSYCSDDLDCATKDCFRGKCRGPGSQLYDQCTSGACDPHLHCAKELPDWPNPRCIPIQGYETDAACLYDDNCGAGHCSPSTQTCQPRLTAGACTYNSLCVSNNCDNGQCVCESHDHCGRLEYCAANNRSCTPRLDNNATCNDESECLERECINNVCVGTTGALDERCGEFPNGRFCNLGLACTDRKLGRCNISDEDSKYGQWCMYHENCNATGYCSDQVCAPKLADSATCQEDAQCASGFCGDTKRCTRFTRDLGSYCDTRAQCLPRFVCSSNTCRLRPNGAVCDFDSDCMSSWCFNDKYAMNT